MRWLLVSIMMFIYVQSVHFLSADPQEKQKLISVDFKNVELANVIRVFSDQYHVNIVAGEGVEGSVTVRLVNVPIEDALKSILSAHGYGYVIEGNIYRVAPVSQLTEEQKAKQELSEFEQLVTEVIELRFLDAQDVKKVLQKMLSSRGKIEILERKTVPGWEIGAFGSMAGGTSSGTTGSSGSASSSGSSSSGLVTDRKSSKEEYEKSRTFIVMDTPTVIIQIKRVLGEMDIMPKQVLIDAMIVEIKVDDGLDFGVKWEALKSLAVKAVPSQNISDNFQKTNTLSDSLDTSQTREGSSVRTRNINNLSGNANSDATVKTGSDMTSATEKHNESNLKSSVFSNFRTVVLSSSELRLVLSALASDGDVDVISNPNILTLDNHEAAILVGENFPIFSTAVSDQGTVTESFQYYQPVGISLRVIPQITADGNINMLIHPAVSEIGEFVTGTTGLEYPRINVREADTQVLIKEGQTVVIGGLMTNRNEETVTRVPLLGDIPVIGWAFKHKSIAKTKINLIVFVTPRLIKPDQISQKENEIFTKYLDIRSVEMKKKEEKNKYIRRKSRKYKTDSGA
ncbi:MAG: type IV pilus secretin PilQ [Chlamydiota bacterium]|nr:type IV pilus secretin PilQ [Chlamydiota bacterium]